LNRLKGKIVAIDSNSHMSLVDVVVGMNIFSATLLETPATVDYLVVGSDVTLLFKETEIALAKNLRGLISLRNRIPVRVTAIERGDILGAVSLDYDGLQLVSVITSRAIDRLEIKVGDDLEALIKANEIALMAGQDGI
jgi:molybdate transport system regulatory protein